MTNCICQRRENECETEHADDPAELESLGRKSVQFVRIDPTERSCSSLRLTWRSLTNSFVGTLLTVRGAHQSSMTASSDLNVIRPQMADRRDGKSFEDKQIVPGFRDSGVIQPLSPLMNGAISRQHFPKQIISFSSQINRTIPSSMTLLSANSDKRNVEHQSASSRRDEVPNQKPCLFAPKTTEMSMLFQ